MAKRWARSKAEANRMFLVKGQGTCQRCGVEFHRLTKGLKLIPTHRPGSVSVEWSGYKWQNGVTTYDMVRSGFVTLGMCLGSRKQPAERVPPPPDPSEVLVKTRLKAGTRSGRPRDSQRGKVYSAEWGAEWSGKALERHDQRSAQQLADRMYAWLRDEGYSVASPRIEMRRGRSAEAFSSGVICLGTGGGNTGWIVAHEMAHLVGFTRAAFPGREWDRDGRSHGWEWASVYLRLVRRFLGVANHDALAAAFKAGKVKFRPKRRMTEAQRAAAAERLAAARAARAAQPST